MSDAMRSEFSPQQRPEVPAANLLAAGEIVVSEADNNLTVKNRMRINKKLALALVGFTAPFIASCGWGNIPNPFSRSHEASPTPVVVPIKDLPTSATFAPKATPTLEPTPTPTPTPKPKVISIGSSVETDPANLSAGEMIKILLPEGIVNGKSPLIPEGDALSVSFKLKSEIGIGISQCSLSLQDLFGIKDHKFDMRINPTNEDAIQNIASSLTTFQSSAKFSISDADKKIASRITLSCVRESRGLTVDLSFPNKQFRYSDKDGSHFVNPAERFASGKVGLRIKRGAIAPGRFALTAEDIKIQNSNGILVATANGFDIIPPRITVASGTPQPDRTIPTKTPTKVTVEPTPRPTVVKAPIPTIEATKIPAPKPKEEENKWTREWPPNETVSVREWWDDMVAKGNISIDAIARQYAGEQINNFLATTNLVPNPVEYYKTGHGFLGTCRDKLDKLVRQGQGHIKVTSGAYAQIPGADECFVVTKDK